MNVETWLALATGVGIAAACGLRAFLPLLLLGLASRFAGLPLVPQVHWLTSNVALIALGVATVLELAADKIPIVDHVLDALGIVVRPAAAWLGAYAVLVHWPGPWAQVVGILLGGGALVLHGIRAKLRLGSTALTLGAANPVISFFEDLVTLILVVTAILAPLLVLAIIFAWVVLLARSNRKAASSASVRLRPVERAPGEAGDGG